MNYNFLNLLDECKSLKKELNLLRFNKLNKFWHIELIKDLKKLNCIYYEEL